MAFQLRTEIGQTIYRLRKCTVEPVIGIIKEVLGFRRFSLRGLACGSGRSGAGFAGLQPETDVHALPGEGVALAGRSSDARPPQEEGFFRAQTLLFAPFLPESQADLASDGHSGW